jgi:hypothetical protein
VLVGHRRTNGCERPECLGRLGELHELAWLLDGKRPRQVPRAMRV